MAGVDDQPAVDEVARPKFQPFIGKIGFQLDRPGGLVDHVVHHGNRSTIQLRRVVLCQRDHRHMRDPKIELAALHRLGRHREDDRDRPQLRDHHDRGALRRAHEIADIDLPDADATIDRRHDGSEAELCLRVGDLRSVVRHRAFILPDLRPLLIDLLLGGKILFHQFDVTGQVEARALQQRLITHPRGHLLL